MAGPVTVEEQSPRQEMMDALMQAGQSEAQARAMIDALESILRDNGRFGHDQLEAALRLGPGLEQALFRMLDRWTETAGNAKTVEELTLDQARMIGKEGAAQTEEQQQAPPPLYRYRQPSLYLPNGFEIDSGALELFQRLYDQLTPPEFRGTIPRRETESE